MTGIGRVSDHLQWIHQEIANLSSLIDESSNEFPTFISNLGRSLTRSQIDLTDPEWSANAKDLAKRIRDALAKMVDNAHQTSSEEFLHWSVTAAWSTSDRIIDLLDQIGMNSVSQQTTSVSDHGSHLAAREGRHQSPLARPSDTDSERRGEGSSRTATDRGLKAQIASAKVEVNPNTEAVVPVPTAPPDSRKIFVVHGHNLKARDAMFDFLRALDLSPIEWEEGVKLTGEGAPYVGKVLDVAFSEAQAVVVILTGDDEARSREQFRDKTTNDDLKPQPRPNVLFEAGMAFGRYPDRTILVEIGTVQPFSDVVGRHAVRFKGTSEDRQKLKLRLETAGCAVNAGTDWLRVGKSDFAAAKRQADGSRTRRRSAMQPETSSNSRPQPVLDAIAGPQDGAASSDDPVRPNPHAVIPSFLAKESNGQHSRAVYLVIGNYGAMAALDVRLNFLDPLINSEREEVSGQKPYSQPIQVLKPGEEKQYYFDDFQELGLPWILRSLRSSYRIEISAKDPLTGKVGTVQHVVDLDAIFPTDRVGPWTDAAGQLLAASHPFVTEDVDPHPDNLANQQRASDHSDDVRGPDTNEPKSE